MTAESSDWKVLHKDRLFLLSLPHLLSVFPASSLSVCTCSDVAGVRCFPPEQEAETRIIGGQEAWAHSWPWQVSLQFSSMSACGGAIIGPLWVISAAHCFIRYNTVSLWKVLAGKHDLDKPQEPEEQLVDVTRIISHHQYDTRTKESDVALVKLDRPLVFNQFVRPIDLWMTPLPDLMRCTITGWGSTRENGPRINRLQEVNVSILSSVDCNEYYGGRVRASMFCAGKDEGGADACQGDSGGPLSCFTGTRHELAGLVSWGVGCGRAKRPGVYTKVQEHVEWISGIMNDENENEEENFDEAENRCGRQRSTCEGVPGVAGISVSPDRVVKVENLTESCPSSWPWMVSLQSSGQHYCSGVLVQHRWVVTAKHCSVSAKEDVVVFGLQDLSQRAVQTILVDEVFSPLHDTSFPPQADLALVRLSIPARFGKEKFCFCPKVQPAEVKLPVFVSRAKGVSDLCPGGGRGAGPELDLHHSRVGKVQGNREPGPKQAAQRRADPGQRDRLCPEVGRLHQRRPHLLPPGRVGLLHGNRLLAGSTGPTGTCFRPTRTFRASLRL
ncbi:transmembrane protease serine 9-like [Nothobranchius furzeri]|uniref:Transmembrane protease serine 9-like n=1 Tax=Nothobranchius furzeri TaxID=105023 RepID=A0A9D2Z171_NOTFU|nr:transmembrane protease serine 9-like [Nothobranchius furzeri]